MERELLKRLENGAIVWDMGDAKAIRELQKEHPEFITIIWDMDELEEILGQKLDGTGKLPYFGAILTDAGKKALL